MNRGILLLALTISFLSSRAMAQEMPSNVEPGAVDTYNVNQQEIKKIQPTTNKNVDPNIKQLINTQDNKNQNAQKLKFILKDITFEGNSVFKAEELKTFASEYFGKEVVYKDITAITTKITEFYTSKGYITSMAYLPPQNIQNGNLKINIIEGKLGNVTVQGNKWTRDYYFKEIVFDNNGVKEDKIFNVNNLKESMVNINSQTYLKGKVLLNKGSQPKTTDIVLDVKDRIPLGLNVSWDNQGRELIGTQRALIGVTDYNLTGFGDQLSTMVSLASGTTGVATGYTLPVGRFGTKLNLGYSYSGVELGGYLEPARIEGTSHFYKIGLMQPIFKNNRFDINSDIGFDFRDSDSTALNNITLNNYQIRALRTGLSCTEKDNNGRWLGRMQTSFGLPILGGQSSGSRSLPDSDFFKLNTNIARIQYLPAKITGIARASMQFAPQALYASEQMQLGGTYTVRGFEDGILLGDVGYGVSFELRRPVPYLKDVKVPYWKDKSFLLPLKDKIHFATFYDYGMAKRTHQGRSANYKNYLQSVGVGLRCTLTKFLTANLDLGIPIGRSRYDGQDGAKLHFSLTSNLF